MIKSRLLTFSIIIFIGFVFLLTLNSCSYSDLYEESFNVNLKSSNAILVSLDNNEVIAKKNSNKRIYPASLTKIMTAIVAIENIDDFNKGIVLSDNIFKDLNKTDASMAGFLPGEEVENLDLLYGIMLPSGAECCIAIADEVSGSEENFAWLMNEKAKELGMDDTNFVNSTGLQHRNHYTTVKDLSILLEYALKNELFKQIFTSVDYITNATNMHPDGVYLKSTLFENMDNQSILNGEILGGKTGYTDEAGLCLASIAILNGKSYLLITTGAKGNHNSEQYNIDDAILVYNNL